MSGIYETRGNDIVLVHRNPHQEVLVASCDAPAKAVELLNKARWLNDVKRRYTAASRHIATAEALPGFRWGLSAFAAK